MLANALALMKGTFDGVLLWCLAAVQRLTLPRSRFKLALGNERWQPLPAARGSPERRAAV